MNRPFLVPLLVGLACVSAAPSLFAQSSIRAGANGGVRSTGNGTTRTGTTNNRGSTGGTGGNSASGSRSYRSNTQLGDAIVQIDPETRSLIIVTDEETHGELFKVIKDLDKPKPQVLIKVVFLEVTYNKDFDLGLEGSYTFNLKNPVSAVAATAGSSTSTTTNGVTTTTSTPATAATAASLGQKVGLSSAFGLASQTTGSFVRVASDDWSATLRALTNHGKVEVLSRPSIMARNNQEAVIVVGQEVPFITNSRTDALGNLTNTIQYDNVGIILRVTPFITSNNAVEMIVAPEISSLTSQTVPISSNASAPVISKRSAETVIVTPNGTTAVIGGLMQTQRIANIQKIPLLGDIPLLGAAFRRKTTNDVKSELLIFLTPTVVNTIETLEAATTEATENTELVKQAFTQKEFEKFFDTLPTRMPDEPAHPGAPVKTGEKRSTVVTKTSTRQPASTPVPKQSPKKIPENRDPASPGRDTGI